jgi:hypothetical protein
MHSKILPWDFLQKYPTSLMPKALGLKAFLIEDPYLERVLLDRLPKKELNFSLYTGNEVTREFIEEHFVNYSFFRSNEPILVMNAESIPAESLELLLESSIDWSERLLLLCFTKSSKAFLSFSKKPAVESIELEAPRFWEGEKLWQFCQKARGVQFDSAVSRFALTNLEHNFDSFISLINTIQIHFPDGAVQVKILQELIPCERWDFFQLIDLFHRSPKSFFEEILKKEMDYDWMRSLASFMQSHLVKILFPEEIKKKAKPTKYDQSVLEMSEKLNREMLKHYLGFFSELEIQAKSNDQFLVNRLRIESLK